MGHLPFTVVILTAVAIAAGQAKRALRAVMMYIPVVAVLLVAGCSPESDMPTATVRIGILPDESEAKLRERYDPLMGHLSESTGQTYELVIPKDYNQLLALFGEGRVDVAYFGGLTFVKAQKNHRAIALVMRDTDLKFRSYFLAPAENSSRAIADFKGLRFAFGSELSTSGHLMPRHHLSELGIDPERFFSEVRYSGAHDRTAFWVRDGEIDLGAANAKIIDGMFADGRLLPGEVKILSQTPSYPDYVWAARSGLSPALQDSIADAFLSLSPADQKHAEILERLDTGGFLPAQISDFSELIQIAQTMGLL